MTVVEPMTIVAPVRHQLRALAERVGVRQAFGGPLPHGRRIAVWVREGEVIADGDESARWRGRVLISERPAELVPERRAAAHRIAQRLAADALVLGSVRDGTIKIDLVLDDDGEHLVGIDGDDGPSPTDQVALVAHLTAGEPASPKDRIVGTLTACELPTTAQVDWSIGSVVDVPMGTPIATIHAVGDSRRAAIVALQQGLAKVRLDGCASNLHLLRQVVNSADFTVGLSSARTLDGIDYQPSLVEVLTPGTHTTIQEHPGRIGYWHVGVPPSGPMDDLTFRLANRLVGNPAGMVGLELTLVGPTLRFLAPAIICLAGPPYAATVDGMPLPMWRAVAVRAGAVLRCGGPVATGCRATLAIRHGLAVPDYLGSRATFDLGGFGGFAGRPLQVGDLVPLTRAVERDELSACPTALPNPVRPVYTNAWRIGVMEGPHAAPDFFQPADMREFYATAWRVHHNSNRTGVRLIGPKPRWARADGGEAGLHPSNIHDNAYAIGAIDFTGDMPILLGPDGPSCGGFVCPAVVVAAERWKLGQLRPGDTVRFVRSSHAEAEAARLAQARLFATAELPKRWKAPPCGVATSIIDEAVVMRRKPSLSRPSLCLRRSGDEYLLLEYGEAVLDLGLRLRVHGLEQALRARQLGGIIDITPGIRSLQVHVDATVLPLAALAELLLELDDQLPSLEDVEVPTRTVHLPLSWDDPATRKAIDIYMRSVRADAPWCPSNLEFIRRINGLDSIDEVKRIVFDAEYLVMGLGDVYLGAPVATPLDPRHRLVTTKYNPARTWTPPNAVGIGGAYLCIYGMEGPGGYQFVGRTVPVWNTWKSTDNFAAGTPWLLRNFDIIKWYEVSAAELLEMRAAVTAGTMTLRVEPGRLRWRDQRDFLERHAADITRFRTRQQAAFAAERGRWEQAKS